MSKDNQTQVNFNLSYDPTPLLTQAKKSIEEEAKKTLFMQIRDFFGSRQDRHFESATGNWVVTTTPGDGLRQIDEMVTKAFCDDVFQKKLDAYFEENWQTIYRDCMVRALQHKANGVAFNKVHDLTLNPLRRTNMPRYFHKVTCYVCQNTASCTEISKTEHDLYTSKDHQINYEEVEGYNDKAFVVYEKTQDICDACIEATPVPDHIQ